MYMLRLVEDYMDYNERYLVSLGLIRTGRRLLWLRS
jgi:hypothetical protein